MQQELSSTLTSLAVFSVGTCGRLAVDKKSPFDCRCPVLTTKLDMVPKVPTGVRVLSPSQRVGLRKVAKVVSAWDQAADVSMPQVVTSCTQ